MKRIDLQWGKTLLSVICALLAAVSAPLWVQEALAADFSNTVDISGATNFSNIVDLSSAADFSNVVDLGGTADDSGNVADFSDAVAIQANQSKKDNVTDGYNSQANIYTFTTEKDGFVKLRFESPKQGNTGSYWTMYFYDASYTEILSETVYGNRTLTESVAVGIPAGEYYIKVTSAARYEARSTEYYDLTAVYEESDVWEKEFNENFTSATAIQTNTEYHGTTMGGNDSEKDFFQFQITQAGVYTALMGTPLLGSTDSYWTMTLYDGKYGELTSLSIPGNETEHTIARTLEAGTYYIAIQSSSRYEAASTEPYSIAVMPSSTVRYDANGGSGAPESQINAYGETLVLRDGVPARKGYIFLGWSVDTGGAADVAYQPGDSYEKEGDATLYAVWAKNSGTVSGIQYKVTDAKTDGTGAVKVTGVADKKVTSLSIRKKVRLDGVSYRVTAIAAGAFENCKKLKTVSIGANVETIGNRAFQGDAALEELEIKTKKLSAIGKKAFDGCKKLKSLTLRSEYLSKSSVKNSLKGSGIETIWTKKRLQKNYRVYFAKGNSGRNVTIRIE